MDSGGYGHANRQWRLWRKEQLTEAMEKYNDTITQSVSYVQRMILTVMFMNINIWFSTMRLIIFISIFLFKMLYFSTDILLIKKIISGILWVKLKKKLLHDAPFHTWQGYFASEKFECSIEIHQFSFVCLHFNLKDVHL